MRTRNPQTSAHTLLGIRRFRFHEPLASLVMLKDDIRCVSIPYMEAAKLTPNRMVTSWAYITEADDVPGCWVAQCFEYGLVTCGDSPQHALEMIRDAVRVALEDDAEHGFDSRTRAASAEEAAPLLRMFEDHKQKIPIQNMDKTSFRRFAVPFPVFLASGATDVAKSAHDSAIVDDAAA